MRPESTGHKLAKPGMTPDSCWADLEVKVGFFQAIACVLRNAFSFEGRATRSEFWNWILFRYGVILIIAMLAVIRAYGQGYSDGLEASFPSPAVEFEGKTIYAEGWPSFETLALVFLALTFIPNAAVSIRRLHDSGKSGWWFVVLNFIPFGKILLFVFYLQRSSPGVNRYESRRHLAPLLAPRDGPVPEA